MVGVADVHFSYAGMPDHAGGRSRCEPRKCGAIHDWLESTLWIFFAAARGFPTGAGIDAECDRCGSNDAAGLFDHEFPIKEFKIVRPTGRTVWLSGSRSTTSPIPRAPSPRGLSRFEPWSR